jgi:hypothetical protein
MSRNRLLEQISNQFGTLQYKLNTKSANNLHDSSVLSETLMQQLFNEIFELKLVNANTIDPYFPAVDLVDYENKVAVQVSTTATAQKLKHTIEKFVENALEDHFSTLYFYILTEKSSSFNQKQVTLWTQGRIQFDIQKHILDWQHLYRLMTGMPIEALEKVTKILDEELGRSHLGFLEANLKVAVSFADEDLDFASKVVSGLLLNRIEVYTSSTKLKEKIRDHRAAGLLKIDDGDDKENEIEHCAVLLTNAYFERFHKFIGRALINRECPLLKRAYERHDRIITHLIREENPLPYFDDFEIRSNHYKVSKSEFQQVIQRISDRIHKDAPKFEGYENFVELIGKAEPNAELTEMDSLNDSGNRIGFRLVKSVDRLRDTTFYYLYLYANINQTETSEYLRTKYPDLIGRNRNVIIIHERDYIKNAQLRLENLKTKFDARKAMYLDDFINHFCNNEPVRSEERGKFLMINNFIYPNLLKHKGHELQNITVIKDWLRFSSDTPVFVLRGGGGIGKSTMARSIADDFQSYNANAKVIFIEVGEIKDQLTKIYQNHNFLNLYHFYQVSQQGHDSKYGLDPAQFEINLERGNLLIVLDGIDEILSRHPNFSVESLLETAMIFKKRAGSGRILITCRSYYWEEESKRFNNLTAIESYEIQPFDANMAREFFEKQYPGKERRINKCLRLAREFSINAEKGEYLPFVLDVVDTMQSYDAYEDEIELSSESSILKPGLNPNDFIVERILSRESQRIGQIDVDNQIRFFTEMAIFDSGRIEVNNLRIQFELLNIDVPGSSLNAFNAHPFLQLMDDSLLFKYDFFEDFFASIYISEVFSGKTPFDNRNQTNIIRRLAKDCKFNSGLLKESRKRIDTRSPKVIETFRYILNQIITLKNGEVETRKALSGLFALGLTANHFQKQGNEERSNTDLLVAIFGSPEKDGIIRNLYIDDFPADADIRFDFSGLYFSECSILNYPSFFDCTFSEQTYFDETCNIHNVAKIGKTSARPGNFDRNMNSVWEIFDFFSQNNQNVDRIEKALRKEARESLQVFFRALFENGQSREKQLSQEVEPYYVHHNTMRNIPFRAIADALIKRNILVFRHSSDRGELVRISERSLIDVNRFCHGALESQELHAVIMELMG